VLHDLLLGAAEAGVAEYLAQQAKRIQCSAEREGHLGTQEDESERFPERKPRLAGVNQVDRAC
jgi:hypothetical protein